MIYLTSSSCKIQSKNATTYGYQTNQSGDIQLKKSVLDNFENILAGNGSNIEKLAALTPVYMTLFHETVRYGDYLDGLRQYGGEPRVDFELDIWGIKGKEEDGT